MIAEVPAAAAPSGRGKPIKQTIQVDGPSDQSDDISEFCGFEVEGHEVGTIQMITFPDGHVQFHQNIVGTFTAPGFGTTLRVANTLQIDEVEASEVFGGFQERTITTTIRGVNYRVIGSSRPFISSGHGFTQVTILYDEFGFIVDVEIDETF